MITSNALFRLLLMALLVTTTTMVLPMLNAMDSGSGEEAFLSERLHAEKIYDKACKLVNKNTQQAIKSFFKKLPSESISRMALRFAYAQKYKKNIDAVRCVSFLNDCTTYWVNTKNVTAFGLGTFLHPHELLSEKYLKYLIPLLEPILKTPVVNLHLSSTQLKSLPKNLLLLQNLSFLDLYAEPGSSRSDAYLRLHRLPKWLAQMPLLQCIIVDEHFNEYFETYISHELKKKFIDEGAIFMYTPGHMLRQIFPANGLIY